MSTGKVVVLTGVYAATVAVSLAVMPVFLALDGIDWLRGKRKPVYAQASWPS